MRDCGRGSIQGKEREGRTGPIVGETKDGEPLMFQFRAVLVEQGGRMRIPDGGRLIPEHRQRTDAQHTDVALVPLPVMRDIHDREKDIPHLLLCFPMPPKQEGVPVTRLGLIVSPILVDGKQPVCRHGGSLHSFEEG